MLYILKGPSSQHSRWRTIVGDCQETCLRLIHARDYICRNGKVFCKNRSRRGSHPGAKILVPHITLHSAIVET